MVLLACCDDPLRRRRNPIDWPRQQHDRAGLNSHGGGRHTRQAPGCVSAPVGMLDVVIQLIPGIVHNLRPWQGRQLRQVEVVHVPVECAQLRVAVPLLRADAGGCSVERRNIRLRRSPDTDSVEEL